MMIIWSNLEENGNADVERDLITVVNTVSGDAINAMDKPDPIVPTIEKLPETASMNETKITKNPLAYKVWFIRGANKWYTHMQVSPTKAPLQLGLMTVVRTVSHYNLVQIRYSHIYRGSVDHESIYCPYYTVDKESKKGNNTATWIMMWWNDKPGKLKSTLNFPQTYLSIFCKLWISLISEAQ
jgi:hypothetical protein